MDNSSYPRFDIVYHRRWLSLSNFTHLRPANLVSATGCTEHDRVHFGFCINQNGNGRTRLGFQNVNTNSVVGTDFLHSNDGHTRISVAISMGFGGRELDRLIDNGSAWPSFTTRASTPFSAGEKSR